MFKYIRATWLPLSFTLVCTWAALYVEGWYSLPFVLAAIFGVFDVRARWLDYCYVIASLANDDKDIRAIRLAHKHRHSRCQRNAMYWAAYEYYLDEMVYEYYYRLGYRWWTILPDGTASLSKCPYLKLSFYKELVLGTGRVR